MLNRLRKPKPRKVQKYPELWLSSCDEFIIQYREKDSQYYNDILKGWFPGSYSRKERMKKLNEYEFIGEIKP